MTARASPSLAGFFLCAISAALVAGCGASTTHAVNAQATSTSNTASTNSTTPEASPISVADEQKARAWAWTAIGCFVGGPWSEASGARPEERLVADVARCRQVVSGPLGARGDDAQALAAVRGLDAGAVQRVLSGIGEAAAGMGERKAALLALVKASADAAREAMMARRLAEEIRRDLAAKEATTAATAIDTGKAVLSSKTALATLYAIGSDEAHLVALVLAADHVEAARGLPPSAKVLVASPAFDVVFATPLPTGEFKPGAWLAYVRAAAKAAGHLEPLGEPAATNDQEKSAFAGVAAGFADRFQALESKLTAPAANIAHGYVKRLRAALDDAAAKAKAKVDAKKTTDDAAKKSKP